MSLWRVPGHRHLPDGELLRLDSDYRHEGVFIGSEYWSDHSLRRQCKGSRPSVVSELESWELEVGS